ncbi:MAG TPA: hypothetical protein VMV07_09755 [Streptosporangiaceae bacterium]|nr:hypothetical protein [Streptosporangiaceae bacterium]
MNVLTIICWSVVAATVAWGLTLRRAAAAIAILRLDTEREIRHWQDQAARARSRAVQLERELVRWSDGCRQGREDVVNMVPMLLAAHGHQPCLCQTGTDGGS